MSEEEEEDRANCLTNRENGESREKKYFFSFSAVTFLPQSKEEEERRPLTASASLCPSFSRLLLLLPFSLPPPSTLSSLTFQMPPRRRDQVGPFSAASKGVTLNCPWEIKSASGFALLASSRVEGKRERKGKESCAGVRFAERGGNLGQSPLFQPQQCTVKRSHFLDAAPTTTTIIMHIQRGADWPVAAAPHSISKRRTESRSRETRPPSRPPPAIQSFRLARRKEPSIIIIIV